jgi:hypothetical protein
MKIAISLAANAKWVDHRWAASYSVWNDRSKLIIHFGFSGRRTTAHGLMIRNGRNDQDKDIQPQAA